MPRPAIGFPTTGVAPMEGKLLLTFRRVKLTLIPAAIVGRITTNVRRVATMHTEITVVAETRVTHLGDTHLGSLRSIKVRSNEDAGVVTDLDPLLHHRLLGIDIMTAQKITHQQMAIAMRTRLRPMATVPRQTTEKISISTLINSHLLGATLAVKTIRTGPTGTTQWRVTQAPGDRRTPAPLVRNGNRRSQPPMGK